MPNIAPIVESIIVLIIVNFQKRFAFEKRNQNKMANSSVNKTNSPLIEESRKRKNTNQLTKLQINTLIIIELELLKNKKYTRKNIDKQISNDNLMWLIKIEICLISVISFPFKPNKTETLMRVEIKTAAINNSITKNLYLLFNGVIEPIIIGNNKIGSLILRSFNPNVVSVAQHIPAMCKK